MVNVSDSEEEFKFHPYIYTPTKITLLALYEERNWQSSLFEHRDLDPLASPVVAPRLLFYKLEKGEAAAMYSPRKVLRDRL